MRGMNYAAPAVLLLAAAVSGCRGETSEDPPIVPIRNMYNQPKYSMQQSNDYFADHRNMRPPVDGTISREHEIDPRVATGVLEDNTGYVLTIPPEVVKASGGMDAMLVRGKERYGIYCSACHGLSGAGDGIVVKRNAGMPAPPSYHDPKIGISHWPDGRLYATIENGKGNMPAYGPQTTVQDRWAIVAYVRALEVSQAQVANVEKKP